MSFFLLRQTVKCRFEEVSHGKYSDDDEIAKIGEILIDRGVVTPDAVNKVLEGKKKIGEELVEKHIVSQDDVESALLEQEHLKKVHSKQSATQNIKISTEKLDDFVNLVGELVTLQAQLNQHTLNTNNYELTNIAESLQRLTEELRDSVLGIRMIPVGQTIRSIQKACKRSFCRTGKEN